MTSKATSNYERITELGRSMAAELTTQRHSNMLDWAQLDCAWRGLEVRLARMHSYDVLKGWADASIPVLCTDLRRRLHYAAAALRLQPMTAGQLSYVPTGQKESIIEESGIRVALEDSEVLHHKGTHYGDSWKRRGGIGAFMMLARKWDRMDNLLSSYNASGPEYLAILRQNPGDVQDDVHDLRRYLLLVHDEAIALGWA